MWPSDPSFNSSFPRQRGPIRRCSWLFRWKTPVRTRVCKPRSRGRPESWGGKKLNNMLRFIAHGRLHRTQNALSTVFYAPRLARSSVPGLLPGTRRTRDIPTEFRATSACHRQFGGDVGPRGPSRGLAPHAASQAYRPTSRARMPCIGGRSGGPGKSPQRCKAPRRLCGGSRIRVDRSQRACRTPAAALVQKAPKTALGWAAAPTQVHRAQLRHQRGAAEKEAGMHGLATLCWTFL